MLRSSLQNRLVFGALAVLVLFAGVAVWRSLTQAASPVDDWARRLARVSTVQGRLSITLQNAELEQELWVVRPHRLRTETEQGPGAFDGTIVVLNEEEGWVFTPALGMATVVERGGFRADIAGQAGAGSILERMPDSILTTLRSGASVHIAGTDTVAGRPVTRLELYVTEGDSSFPPGILNVWLDREFAYPLRWRDSSGRELRFSQVLFNQPVDPATFVFFPPPGAHVQRVQPGS